MRRARNYTGAFRAPLKITRNSQGDPLPVHLSLAATVVAIGVAVFGFLVMAPLAGFGFIWVVALPVASYFFYSRLQDLGHSPFTLLRGTFIARWAWVERLIEEHRRGKLPKGRTRMPLITPTSYADQLKRTAVSPAQRVSTCNGFVFGSPVDECSWCGRPSWEHKEKVSA